MVSVSGLFVYPVKSTGGISILSGKVEPRGFRHDRRWMVVDKDGNFLSQRTVPALALIRSSVGARTVELSAPGRNVMSLPLEPSGDRRPVVVWNDVVEAVDGGDRAAEWFSAVLGMPCRLVGMPESSRRPVSLQVTGRGDHTSFADAFPFLLLSQASLDYLNGHLPSPVPMDRFRPNIVVNACAPFEEDTWRLIRVGEVRLHVVKPCSRCVITTIDQATAKPGEEPLRTLSRLRQFGNHVLFGQNCIPEGEGFIHVGDRVEVLTRGPGP
jgi:MOSC domain-containing protein